MTYAAQRVDTDLQDIALRLDFDGGKLLCADAICLGDWVLLEALQRTEAGELHASLGGRPLETRSSPYPWKIRLIEGDPNAVGVAVTEEERPSLPEGAHGALKRALSFQYEHVSATKAPSKQTATDRKGRIKDEEAAENTQESKGIVRSWRQPSFVTDQAAGKKYGNAIHAAMQYVRYENCKTVEQIRQEIHRLVQQKFLTAEQGELVNCQKLYRFFDSEIGRKLQAGIPNLREFKFSILDDGDHYGDGLEGEQVLLQGVVDCALLEEDGITVVDFKTDRVTEETLGTVAERYREQVLTYAEALSRIYEMPVKEKYLYFFRLDKFVKV